jgi:flagellar motor switch protein FliG
VIDLENKPVEQETVSGASAAAILLLLLSEDEATTIVRRLDPDQVKILSKAMFAAASASEAKVEAALDHFVQRSRLVPSLSIGAEPRIRGLMTQALGNVRADNLLSAIAPQSSQPCLELLRWMEVPMLARLMREEHPQVAALILAVLQPATAALAIADLPDEVQADLLYRAAQLSLVSADAIVDLEALLKVYSEPTKSSPKVKLGGKQGTAKIVNAMPRESGGRILKSVKKRSKSIGQEIEDEMFIFDNLIDLDAKTLGTILRSVDAQLLTLALKGASQALTDKALSSMSARAAESIRDDMADSGPTKRAEVEEAQKTVILIVRQLADDGTILLGGKGDDYV